MTRSAACFLACTIIAAVVFVSCKKGTPASMIEERREGIMGTRISVKVWSPGGSKWEVTTREGIEAAFDAAREVQSRMSPYDPTSAVSRVNAAAGGEAVEVDSWTWEVLDASVKASRLTRGAFDPTWAALADIWDYRAPDPAPPSKDEVEERLALVGVRGLEMDAGHRTVRLARTGMRIGLGGSAKGFALDRMAEALRERSLEDFICYAGGDLYVSGRSGDRPWKLGIQHPRDAGELLARYPVTRSMAVVTSGDYERFFMHRGTRYHHILDPRTGFPARGTMSVTVMAPAGLEADALSTGLLILGAEEAFSLLAGLEEVEAVIVDEAGKVHCSSGICDLLEMVAEGYAMIRH
ncbi:MAG: FAD:protein FMN transferase [Deltaproteobacteria bacterium]|nr:FAD:protein FMN transferase [Deltaproteobacteria bacterium]